MFIDTHCHLTDDSFSEILNEVLVNAKENNVGKMISVSAEQSDFQKIINLIKEKENIFGSLGIHPDYADKQIDYSEIFNLAKENKKIIAIGETGLDYYEEKNHSDEMKKEQAKNFIEHLKIARELNLPIIIHSRDSARDTEEILKQEQNINGVMHCYTGSWESAKILLDLGYYFSTSGIITFKNADRVRETFSKIPLDRIITETDAPYCSPVPYRGKTNQPAYMIETAKMLASIKGIEISEMEDILYKNSTTLFSGLNK